MKRSKPGRPPGDDQLTPAEWKTVEGVRHGLTNPQLAARLGISVDGVKFHVGNALGKLGLASRAELQRWTGVRRDSPLSVARPAGPADSLAGSPVATRIGQIARYTRDIEAAVRWYVDTLGLMHLYTFGDMAFLACGEIRLLVGKGEPAQNSLVYFETGDIVAAHAGLVARDVRIVAAPHLVHRHADGTEEWMCFFHDPDGGTLALMSTVGRPADQQP